MCVFSKEMGEFVNFDNVDFYDENDEKGTYYLGMDIGRKNDRTGISVLKLVKDKIYLENIITLDKCEYQE